MSTPSEELYRSLSSENQATTRICVLILGRLTIETDLEELRKPPNTLILLLSNVNGPTPANAKALSRFDRHIYYSTDPQIYSSNMTSTLNVEVPEIEEIVVKLVQIFGVEKLRLLPFEEYLLGFVARLRQKFAIFGAEPSDVERFLNKSLLKTICRENRLQTADFVLLSFPAAKESHATIADDLETQLGFPMFVKPANGVGSAGGAHIKVRQELLAWIQTENDRSSPVKKLQVLAEKSMLRAVELSIYAWVDRNGICQLLFADELLLSGGTNNHDSLQTGSPFSYLPLSVNEADRRFPGLKHFAEQVFRIFAPPRNSLTGAQIFYEKGEFCLCELHHRFGSPACTPVILACFALNEEAMLIEANLSDAFELPMPIDQNTVTANICFPFKTGRLSNKDYSMGDAVIEGRITRVEWLCDVGERRERAASLRDVVCRVWISSGGTQEAIADIDSLMKHFQISWSDL